MKRLSVLLVLFATLFVLTLPLRAQDATAEAMPVVTLEAAPVTIVNGEGEGTTINVNTSADTDTPSPSSSVPTPVVIVGAALAGLVFLGLLYNQQVIIKLIAPLVPVESAQALVDAVLPTVMSAVMNAVTPVIPGEIDDILFTSAAAQRGFTAVRGEDGLYHVTRTPATPVQPSITDHNWPERPSSK